MHSVGSVSRFQDAKRINFIACIPFYPTIILSVKSSTMNVCFWNNICVNPWYFEINSRNGEAAATDCNYDIGTNPLPHA